jgi:alpha/beta hydrolase family protein
MIHALPGMGADRRMYPAPWTQLPEFVAHDWVRHSGEATLTDVARSMIDAYGICDGDVLVGASLGGMVSCEITKLKCISRLYLIGSAVDQSEVSRLLSFLRPLARIAPFDLIRLSSGSIPTEFTQMFSGIEASFIRQMCTAIFEWEGLVANTTIISRIHGRFDRVIPHPKHVDLLLNGGHLISISHARQCAEFIMRNESRYNLT